MANEFTFSIGSGGNVTVRSYGELQRWLDKERAKWAWLDPDDEELDRNNIASSIQGAWDSLLKIVATYRDNDYDLDEDLRVELKPLERGPLLISTTQDGTLVLDIQSVSGNLPAAFAAGFINGQLSLQNARTKDDLLGAVLTLFPNLGQAADWHERLKRERANYKTAARSLMERLTAEVHDRIAANVVLAKRGSGIAKRIFDQKRERWNAVLAFWQTGAIAAVADIRATEASYKEYMKLKAPVEYWEGKANDHRIREGEARKRLLMYFPVTLMIMAIAFVGTAYFLIRHPDTASSKAPIALYVVVSGGLIVLSTIAFWIGRILTKLYLSEHHLRNDAEERAVMTTTYLALTSEGAASDTDRQIVLNALFRATPDGIVKDDGPSDASLQGLIARLVTK